MHLCVVRISGFLLRVLCRSLKSDIPRDSTEFAPKNLDRPQLRVARFASVSKRVLVHNLSYGNEFYSQFIVLQIKLIFV